MIRNQFIHQVAWSDEYRAMAEFGRARLDEERAVSLASRSGDPHMILFRCTGKEAPEFQRHFNEEIEFVQVFSILPNSIGGIHKDGLNRQCAFNVPIQNCDNGLMQWFEEGLEHRTYDTAYTKVRIALNTDGAVPVFSTIVDTPAMVNTNVWHRMNNAEGSGFRYMLSLRFTRNPTFAAMAQELQ